MGKKTPWDGSLVQPTLRLLLYSSLDNYMADPTPFVLRTECSACTPVGSHVGIVSL